MPPVQKNSVVLKKQATKVWRHLGHNLDGAIAKCLLCKYNPAKGDAHKSSHHINIPFLRFSLGHQGLPRIHQSLEKPPAGTSQEGVRGHGEGGAEEVQGRPQIVKRSLSNCCLTSCPPWTSWDGGSITRHSSPFLPSSRWSSQCQLLHLNLSGSFLSPAVWSPPRRPT